MRRSAWVLMAALAAVLLSGCAPRQATARPAPRAKSPAPAPAPAAYHAKIELSEGDLGVPFFPGAERVMTAQLEQPDKSVRKTAQLATDAGVEEVYRFYRARFEPPLTTDLLSGGSEPEARLARRDGRDRVRVTVFRRNERTIILIERQEAAPDPPAKGPPASAGK